MRRTKALPWLLAGLGAVLLVAAGQMMPWAQWGGGLRALLAPDTAALQQTLATDRKLASAVPVLEARLRTLPAPPSRGSERADAIGFLGEVAHAAGSYGVRIASTAFGPTSAGVRGLSVTLSVQGSMVAQAHFVQTLEHGSPAVRVTNWTMTGQGGQIALNLLYH